MHPDGNLAVKGTSARPTTVEEDQANGQAAETEAFISRSRAELEDVDVAIAAHERALHALGVRRQMLGKALSVLDDQESAPAIPQTLR